MFDVIYAQGELTLDKPLEERSRILDHVFADAKQVAPQVRVNSQGTLMFEAEIGEEAASGWTICAPSMRADLSAQLELLSDEAGRRAATKG